MEDKNLKVPVFVNETVFADSTEQPIDIDFTLPDYCPDIIKILKCRAVSRISSKSSGGRSVTVEGVVTVNVIYSDDCGRLCSYEYQYPFSKSFESNVDCEGCALLCKTKCEYINCRAVTSRKIDIHGAAGIYVRLQKRKCTEIVSDVDDECIELRRGCAPATSPMGYADKYLMVEEEIEISQGQPPIRSLIRYDACAAVKESKILQGKIMVKGELVLTLLYCPDEGGTQQVRSVIPFSQLLEIEGINDMCECEADADIAYLEIKPRVNASGDAKSFQLNAKLLVSCESFCNNDIEVIFDAYSRKYEADIIKNEVCFNKICHNINESFNCKKNLEFPEGALQGIEDMWCDVRTDSVKCLEGNIVFCGTVIAAVVARDNSGEPSLYEKPIEFEYKCPIDESDDTIRCEPQIKVASSNYTLTSSGNMELRIELAINAAVYKCTKLPLITDVRINDKQQIHNKAKGAMTIYFASTGESVWDIARRYCAAVEEIKQINDINEDVLADDEMILVPMC